MNLRVRNFVRSHEQYEQILERGYRFWKKNNYERLVLLKGKREKERRGTVKMDGLLSDTFYK